MPYVSGKLGPFVYVYATAFIIKMWFPHSKYFCLPQLTGKESKQLLDKIVSHFISMSSAVLVHMHLQGTGIHTRPSLPSQSAALCHEYPV